MSPPRQREDSATIAVLTTDVAGLKGRVDKLEERMDDREDSQGGYRKLLDEHRIEDLKAFGKVEALITAIKVDVASSIGEVEKKIAASNARLGMLRWMLVGLLVVALTGSGWILVELYKLASAVAGAPR